ncbi:hypothetical protein [Thaumasiovibrio sp. DFM-14]|uniref:hypothetical protein n=1 Tax=Thaumasiovibrio sp. DFM-14 TaxID=3384792 RepID=UPI0039A206EB
MSNAERIADLEQQAYLAFAEGDYEKAEAVEMQIEKLRQSHANVFDSNHNEGPYTLEGRLPDDDH